MRKMLDCLESFYIIKYVILGVSVEILAETRIPYPVVFQVPVTLETISKCQEREEIVADPVVKKN